MSSNRASMRLRKLKLFFACLLMAVLSIGQVWATDPATESVSISTYAATNSWVNGTSYTTVTIDANVSATGLDNGNNSKYYSSNSSWRHYEGDNGTITIATTSGTLSSVTFTYTNGNSGVIKNGTTNVTSGSACSVSGTSVVFSVGHSSGTKNGNVQITAISVTYTPAGGGSAPTLSSVAVSGTPTTKTYEEGNAFDVTGLTVTGTYSDDSKKTETTGITWTACKTENGTYVALDNEAVALAVSETGIYVKATVSGKTSPAFHVTDLTVSAAEVPTLTFDFSGQDYENGVQYTSINADANITISFGDGDNDGKYYNTGTAMRVYGGGHMTVAGKEGVTISKIVLVFGTGDGSNEISTNVVTYSDGTWTGSAQSVTFNVGGTTGHRRIKIVKVFYEAAAVVVQQPSITGETPFLTSTTVTLTQAAADHIYYTTNGANPTTGSTEYTVPFTLTNSATVKAIAVKGSDESVVAEKTFTKIPTKTVAEAIDAIPNKDDVVNDQYVSGIVCTAGTSVSSGKMTYYISDDGSETNRLQIYKGKNLNNTNFTNASDLAIGDRVVVFGQLKNYNNTPEMNEDNYLVSKEGPAVATPVFTPNGGGFMGETDVTITCATTGSAIYYTLNGSAPSKSSTLYEGAIHLTATTTIKAVAYVGDDASLVISKTFTLTAPMTVAEALAALDTENPKNNVAVAGIISTAPTSNPSSGKLTYYISDDGTASDQLEVYLGFGLNGASFSNKTDLQVGDEVTVFGNLKIYNTTKEFDAGSRLLAFNRPAAAVTSINLTESTAEVEEGKTVTLHASVVPANATNQTIVWSVQSGSAYASVDDGVVTGIATGEAVIRAASDEDASIYAECTVTVTEPAPLSPWATVYTSNVTLSTTGGTSASAAKVKFYGEEGDGYDAIKAGTSGNSGAVKVTVPAQATKLHFHAYGWSSESIGLTVTAPTGVTVSPSTEISINSNAGLTGNTPFTLAEGSDPKTDAYYVVALSGNAEETTLTFTATSGKRFVLFGVNQEGGQVPELDHITITGELANKDYELGDEVDKTGLTVRAYYTLAGVAHHNEDVTSDVVWSNDPLTGGQTSVDVTATYGGKSDTKACAINAVVVPTPEIILSESALEFSGKQYGAVANKTFNVTLKNVAAATVALSGDDAAKFSIDPAALTANGTVTVSVANTNVAGSFRATITVSDDAHAATSQTVDLTLTITADEAPASTTAEWIEATEIYDGMPVLITGVNTTTSKIYAMGAQNDNNRAAVEATLNGDVLIPGNGTKAFTLVKQDDDTYAIMTSDGKYLYAASSSKNYLRTQTDVDADAKWTITVTSASAEGSSNRHVMQFNTSGLFSCYESASQAPIKLYTPKTYTRTVNGNYGTICLPNGGVLTNGALYEIAEMDYQDNKPYKIYFDEVEGGVMEAGKPYIFKPNDGVTVLRVVYTDATDAAEGHYNGLYGKYSKTPLAKNNGNYILKNNQYYYVNSDNVYCEANRAYIVLAEVPAYDPGKPAYGRRRIALNVNNEQVATDIDALNASETPVKVMIDGQLFILRGEKMYDATGRLVK